MFLATFIVWTNANTGAFPAQGLDRICSILEHIAQLTGVGGVYQVTMGSIALSLTMKVALYIKKT